MEETMDAGEACALAGDARHRLVLQRARICDLRFHALAIHSFFGGALGHSIRLRSRRATLLGRREETIAR